MGDGPNLTASEGRYRRIADMPWPQEEPLSVPRHYGPNGEPNNALDARHQPLYPDELPRNLLPAVPATQDSQEPNYSEQFHAPGKIRLEQPVETPTTLRGEFPTPAQVRADAGRYWNTNVDAMQLGWNAYKLYFRAPKPKFPPMFPMKPFKLENAWANAKNLANCPAVIGGTTFLAEVGLDALTGFDKNEYQTFRIGADLLGPQIALGNSSIKSLVFKTWWGKSAAIVGTHMLGRSLDKITEAPIKKWMRTADE